MIFFHLYHCFDLIFPRVFPNPNSKCPKPVFSPSRRFLCGETVSAVVQARVFVHPTYFLDRARVELRYYCAEPSFDRCGGLLEAIEAYWKHHD